MVVRKGKRLVLTAFGLLLTALLTLAGCAGRVPEPTLEVTLQQVGQDLLVQMDTGAFKIPEHGHLHVRLDDGPEAMPYTNSYQIPNVTPGKHTVSVELSDVQHNPLGVKVVKEIEIK